MVQGALPPAVAEQDVAGPVQRRLQELRGITLHHGLQVGQGQVVLPGAVGAVAPVEEGVQRVGTVRVLGQVVAEGPDGLVALLVEVELFGAAVVLLVQVQRAGVHEGEAAHVGLVLAHATLLHVDGLDPRQRVARTVHGGVLRHDGLELVQRLLRITLPLVDQRGLQHALPHVRGVGVLFQHLPVVGQGLGVLLQVQVGLAKLVARIGRIPGVRVLVQQFAQHGQLLIEAAFQAQAHALLVHGVVAVGRAGADGIVVPLDGLRLVLHHEVGVTDPQHGVAALAGLPASGAHEPAEAGGGLAVLLLLEVAVALAVAGQFVQLRAVGPGAVAQGVVGPHGGLVLALGVEALALPVVAARVHLLVHRVLERTLEEQRGVRVLAPLVKLYPAVEGQLLVGLLQAQVLVAHLVQGLQRILIVARLQVHVQQELVGLVVPGGIGILLQVVPQGHDGLVVRVEGELVAELGVVEERVLRHLGVNAHGIGPLEGVARVVLLVQLQVGVGHVVGGHLPEAVVLVRHQVELVDGLLVPSAAVVRIAQHVPVVALHPADPLGRLLQVGQRLGVFTGTVVGLAHQAIDLVDPPGAASLVQQGPHHFLQLVVLALEEEDLGDVEGHDPSEVRVVAQLLEAG